MLPHAAAETADSEWDARLLLFPPCCSLRSPPWFPGLLRGLQDGLPEAWYSPGFAQVGGGFQSREHVYTNEAHSALLMYHVSDCL